MLGPIELTIPGSSSGMIRKKLLNNQNILFEQHIMQIFFEVLFKIIKNLLLLLKFIVTSRKYMLHIWFVFKEILKFVP